MQKKSKPERLQEIELEIVLVNQILKNLKPVLNWKLFPPRKNPDIAQYTFERTKDCKVEICSSLDSRLRQFPKEVEKLFRITNSKGYSWRIPIGALRDTDEEAVALQQLPGNMIKVAVPREFYSIVLAIRDIFEVAGLYVTDSEVIRYMFWTKRPTFFTPGGFAMTCNTTSWYCSSGGQLCLFETKPTSCNLQEFCSFREQDIVDVFNFNDWDIKFSTTLVSLQRVNPINLLTIELFKRIDVDKDDNGTGDSTKLLKEDTNNESIKRS